MRRLGLAAALAVLPWMPALADQVTALQAVRAQPRVIDAQMDKSGNLYVIVKPDKVSWSQYAAGMCGVVKPHQALIFRVRVIEVAQVNHGKPPGSWTRLAEADCSR